MKLLVLYGVNCTTEIWDRLIPFLSDYEIDFVAYPHEITSCANCVDDISKWVYETYHNNSYDAVIGHSLGGIVALQLAAHYKMNFKKVMYLDTNLKPAEKFYRNLMTPEHMEQYGDEIIPMFKQEQEFYTPQLFESIQDEFDYTNLLRGCKQTVYAIYGDRNSESYEGKIKDLNLSEDDLTYLDLRFIHNACHMIMIENPEELANVIKDILTTKAVE